ncbi:MAG: STAS domain-containing protein [Planctomycetota bacterium]|nr:STAS domain-containing protein [Planctomycetota bacterium]
MADPLPTHKKSAYAEIQWNGATLMIKPAGPHVGQKEAPILAAEIEPYLKAAGKGLRHLVVDLADVQFMSSMGLGTLINCRTAAHSAGASAVLVHVNKELKGLLAMMKIDKFFKLVDDDVALKALLTR